MKQALSNFRHPQSRRQFLKVAGELGLFATGTALLGGCGSPANSGNSTAQETLEITTIKIIQSPSLCTAPQFLAQDILKADGFTDIQYVKRSTNLIADALTSGAGDISMHFSGPVITSLDTSGAIMILAGVHIGCFELFGTESIRTILDLKGKTIAITDIGGGDHVFLSSMAAYVGLDPRKDINWITRPMVESKQLLAEGKIDGLLAFPPVAQELKAKKIGQLVVNSMMDKPWSQYFCCVIAANRDFVTKNPVAAKRAVRAILKGSDICALHPDTAARFVVDRGYTDNYDYALTAMQEIPYNRWRDYDPEDTLRFYALRLHEAGMIQSSPDDIIARSADWRFLNEIKKELPKLAWTPARTAFICNIPGRSTVGKT